METILLNISCTCTNLFTYWTRKFILVRGRIASSFQLRFRVPTTIPYAPPFCGSGGAVELPTSSFYQLLCSPRILGLYLTIVWGYHLIHTDSVHDGPAGSILSTFTVMDQIRCATYKRVLLNCGNYFVLDGDMFIYFWIWKLKQWKPYCERSGFLRWPNCWMLSSFGLLLTCSNHRKVEANSTVYCWKPARLIHTLLNFTAISLEISNKNLSTKLLNELPNLWPSFVSIW